VGLWAAWHRAGLQNTQVLKQPANCNGGRGPDCRGGRACEAARLRMAILDKLVLAYGVAVAGSWCQQRGR
jgi:hypothetical protein